MRAWRQKAEGDGGSSQVIGMKKTNMALLAMLSFESLTGKAWFEILGQLEAKEITIDL